MTLPIRIALFALLVAATGAILFGSWDLHLTQVAARQNSSQLGTVLNGTKATLELLDRPCASRDASGHLLPDGPICELDQAIHDVRKIATSSGKQVEQTGLLIDAATKNLNEMGTAVKGTATALTGTAQQATTDLETADQTIQAAQPVLAHLDGVATASETAIQTINDRFRDPRIDALLTHIEGMSDSGDKMLADAQWKEHEILHPTPAKGFKAVLGGAVLWIHRLTPPIF